MSEPSGSNQNANPNPGVQAGSTSQAGTQAQGGQQGAGQQGQSQQQGSNADAGGDAPATDQDRANPNESRFMTKEALRGILDHQKRTTKEDLDRITKSFEKLFSEKITAEIAPIKDLVSKVVPGKRTTGDSGDLTPDLEVTSLKRQVEESQRQMNEMRTQLDQERATTKESNKRSKILDALRRFDCVKPEVAYQVIKDSLQLGDDGQTVFATIKDPEWGAESKIALDDYVRAEVRDKLIPELFKGMNRGGSPAGGDMAGAAAGRYKFTVEQIKDPAFYRKHRDEIDVALQRNEVKGVSPPIGSAGR